MPELEDETSVKINLILNSDSCGRDTTNSEGQYTIDKGVVAYHDDHCGSGIPGIGPHAFTNVAIGGNYFGITGYDLDTIKILVKAESSNWTNWEYDSLEVDLIIEVDHFDCNFEGHTEIPPDPFSLPELTLNMLTHELSLR